MVLVDETWESIAQRMGVKAWRRGRGECPFCESKTGFSVHEEKGFHCFACGVHGDKLTFVQQFHKCEFKDALRFFGLEPGKPPAPDPERIRRQRIRDGLKRWTDSQGKQLRYEHYVMERVIARANVRLEIDPEDEWAWSWLAWALPAQEVISYKLDLIEGDERQQLEAFRLWRIAA